MATTTSEPPRTPSPVVITSFPTRPLTTTFTPPATCSGIYSSIVGIIDDQPSCMPSGFGRSSTDFFSPGIACPSGYYTACHDTIGVSSITTVTCCPIRGSITLSCADATALSNVWATLFCTWMAPPDGAPVTLTLSDRGTTSTAVTTMTSPEGLNAYGVRMVYESTDVATTTTTAGSSTSTMQTGGVGGGSEMTTSPTMPTQSSSGSGGLSTGGIAAIAVVVPVVVLALLGGLLFWLWRKRKRGDEQQHDRPELPGVYGYYGDAAKPQWQEATQRWPPRTRRPPPVELPSRQQAAVELPAESPPVVAPGRST
ncbi:hypothetical protein VTK56DRAFT_6478 [Thermocarpiscus australiensis]